MNWLEPHHLYWGAIAKVAGIWIMFYNLWLGIAVYLLGEWWFIDDLYQHARQVCEPNYTSPWHRWYIAFLRWFK